MDRARHLHASVQGLIQALATRPPSNLQSSQLLHVLVGPPAELADKAECPLQREVLAPLDLARLVLGWWRLGIVGPGVCVRSQHERRAARGARKVRVAAGRTPTLTAARVAALHRLSRGGFRREGEAIRQGERGSYLMRRERHC